MTDPASYAPGPAEPAPSHFPRWRVWLVVGISVLALAVGIPVALHGQGETQPAAAASKDPWAYTVPSVLPEADPVLLDPEPSASEAPEAAWTPCNVDAITEDEGACEDMITDACDGAFESRHEGDLLEAFIENKDIIDAARLKDCPQFLPTWRKAQAGFDEGSYEVGKDVKAGTYETFGGPVGDCYWERSGSNGHTIANDFVTAAKKVRVTIHQSDEMFTSQGCGDWMRVGS